MQCIKNYIIERLNPKQLGSTIIDTLEKLEKKSSHLRAWIEMPNILKSAGFIEIPDYEYQSARLTDYVDYFKSANAKAFINNGWTIFVANTQEHPISEDNPVFFIHRYDDKSMYCGKMWGKKDENFEAQTSKQFKEDIKRVLLGLY